MEDELILSDQLNMHTDRKKLDKLVETGQISAEELANAPIIEMEPSCECDQGLEMSGNDLVCPACRKKAVEASV